MSKGTPNRRSLFAIGAGLAAVATGWQLWLGRETPLDFEPIQGLPGWRRIAFDDVTGTASDAIFVGIGAPEAPSPLSPQSLCAVLYAKADKGIPSAVFTDVNCPNCARLEAKLKARSHALALNWHDLPLLGPTSEIAARAMVAGDLQKNGAAFRDRVQNTNPGRLRPATLGSLAEDSGLNADRLLKDIEGPQVDAVLRQSRRAAQTLGVWGTPGFTIGRTFVLGDMREDVLDQLIAEENDWAEC